MPSSSTGVQQQWPALSSNERALHDLSQAHGRTGLCSGQTMCSPSSPDGLSGHQAARRMHISGWFALLIPLLWPFLAMLSFFQRLHVVKAFRVSSESPIMTGIKAVLCMPCSLWQVRTFLDERQCEEKFRKKVPAEEREEDRSDLAPLSQSSQPPLTWSPGLPHRVFSMTSDDARGMESRVDTSAPGIQAMNKQGSVGNRSLQGLGSWQRSSGRQTSGLSWNSKRSSDLATPSVSQSGSSSGNSSYQEVTAAFIPSSAKKRPQPPRESILASIVVQNQLPRMAFNSSPRHNHFDERHVYIPELRDPSSSPAPWTGDKLSIDGAKTSFQLEAANCDAAEQGVPRSQSIQEQEDSPAVQRWMRVSEMKANGKGQADAPVTRQPSLIPSVLEPESDTGAISEIGERESAKPHCSTRDKGSEQDNKTSKQARAQQAGGVEGGLQSPRVSKGAETVQKASGRVTTIKGGKGWAALRKKPLPSLNKDLWAQAAQTSAQRREIAAAATSPKVPAGDSSSGLGQGAYPDSPSALPRSGSLSTHRPDPIAAAAAAKSLRSRQQNAWRKAFDSSRNFRRSSNSKQPLQQLPEGSDEDHSRSDALVQDAPSATYAESSALIRQYAESSAFAHKHAESSAIARQHGESSALLHQYAESSALVRQSPQDDPSSSGIVTNRESGGVKAATRSDSVNGSDTARHRRNPSSTHEPAQLNSPPSQAASKNSYEQLSQQVSKVTENMSAIMALGGKGQKKGGQPDARDGTSSGKRSVGGAKGSSTRNDDNASAPLLPQIGNRAPQQGKSRSPIISQSPRKVVSASPSHAGNVFTSWWGGNSSPAPSSPTSGTDRPDSPDVMHRSVSSSDYKPPTDSAIGGAHPNFSDIQMPAGSTGAQQPFSSPRFSAVLTGSTMPPTSAGTPYDGSDGYASQESLLKEASGHLRPGDHHPVKGEHSDRLTEAKSASVPKRSGGSLMQAISSAMGSAIDSFSMMSQKHRDASTELAGVAPSRGLSQYQSSFIRGGGSSRLHGGGSMMDKRRGALSAIDSNSSFTSDASSDASSAFKTPSGALPSGGQGSGCKSRMSGGRTKDIDQTLAAFADSVQLAAPSKPLENPLTFSTLAGGDDDTPTAQFFDEKLLGSKARPHVDARMPVAPKTAAQNIQFSPPGKQVDPRADGFWTSGNESTAVNPLVQPTVKPPRPPGSHRRMPSTSAEGAGSRQLGMPGVFGVVEDSGVLEVRPESGSRQTLWHTHSSGYSAQQDIPRGSDDGSTYDQPTTTDVSRQASGDEGTSTDTRQGLMIRRLSDVLRAEDVPMPESNANDVDIAKLIESHANGDDMKYYSPTPSAHGGSISDLEF